MKIQSTSVSPSHVSAPPSSFAMEPRPLATTKFGQDSITKTDLRPGDILLKVNEDYKASHLAIIGGQRMGKAGAFFKNPDGNSSITHAALWIKDAHTAPRTEAAGPGQAEISESRGGKHKITLNTAIRHGKYQVYRPADSRLGKLAAKNAEIWGDDRSIPYNTKTAMQSVVGSSTYNDEARAIAKKYGDDAFKPNPSWGADGSYCSQYVMAAYQGAAVAKHIPLNPALQTNGKFITPRKLHEQLVKNPADFQPVGMLRVRPEDIPYKE